MTSPLKEAQAVLDDLERELAAMRSIWVDCDNPDCDSIRAKTWVNKYHRCWLHGATQLDETNELERTLFDRPPLTAIAQSAAKKIHTAWRDSLEAKLPLGAYYVDHVEFAITSPRANESLIDYLLRLAKPISTEGKSARLPWRALKSFLAFIRSTYPENEVAFVDHVFPKKMHVLNRTIIKLITLEAYPIPENTAAQILIALAQQARQGRPDAQLTATEALGFCWLCLTAARLRHSAYLEVLHQITPSVLYANPDPTLEVPTVFGARPARVSQRVYQFLAALSRTPSKQPRTTLFQRPFPPSI